MNISNNIQNKVCSFNIMMNNHIITNIPLLFRINESGNRSVNDIINDHLDNIFDKIYNSIKTLDDINNISITGIIYDIDSEQDIYDTYELDVTDRISFTDERLCTVIADKINEYANLVLKKMNINNSGTNFVETYDIICKNNKKKINKQTFIQYILSCFNKEYGNKFSNVVDKIMIKELNND